MDQEETRQIHVRLTISQLQWLDSKTKRFVSRSDVLRDLIDLCRLGYPEMDELREAAK